VPSRAQTILIAGGLREEAVENNVMLLVAVTVILICNSKCVRNRLSAWLRPDPLEWDSQRSHRLSTAAGYGGGDLRRERTQGKGVKKRDEWEWEGRGKE